MTQVTRFSQLSAPRQVLVRLLQSVHFGYVEGLEVRGGEPMFSPAPAVFAEVKLDAPSEPWPGTFFADFELRTELTRLIEQLDLLGDGSIDRIDVQYGVPLRAVIERPFAVVRR